MFFSKSEKVICEHAHLCYQQDIKSNPLRCKHGTFHTPTKDCRCEMMCNHVYDQPRGPARCLTKKELEQYMKKYFAEFL